MASVLTLRGCHTQARSLDELMERIKEAIALCLEVEGETTETLDFVGVQRVRLASCTRLPRLTGPELIAALAKAGFQVVRVKGSHHFVRHQDGRATVIPAHSGDLLGPGITAKILRDCDLTRAASDLLTQTGKLKHPGEIKPEITESMIEISTGIHSRHGPLLAERQVLFVKAFL